jgi:hypothetical protein
VIPAFSDQPRSGIQNGGPSDVFAKLSRHPTPFLTSDSMKA